MKREEGDGVDEEDVGWTLAAAEVEGEGVKRTGSCTSDTLNGCP